MSRSVRTRLKKFFSQDEEGILVYFPVFIPAEAYEEGCFLDKRVEFGSAEWALQRISELDFAYRRSLGKEDVYFRSPFEIVCQFDCAIWIGRIKHEWLEDVHSFSDETCSGFCSKLELLAKFDFSY